VRLAKAFGGTFTTLWIYPYYSVRIPIICSLRKFMWSRILLALTLCFTGCTQEEAPSSPLAQEQTKLVLPVCPRKTTCKEMTSCAEAAYQLTTCHQYALDKNRTGIPCQKEHCGPTKEEMLKRITAKPYTPPPATP
jgi:hypothetical protein